MTILFGVCYGVLETLALVEEKWYTRLAGLMRAKAISVRLYMIFALDVIV